MSPPRVTPRIAGPPLLVPKVRAIKVYQSAAAPAGAPRRGWDIRLWEWTNGNPHWGGPGHVADGIEHGGKLVFAFGLELSPSGDPLAQRNQWLNTDWTGCAACRCWRSAGQSVQAGTYYIGVQDANNVAAATRCKAVAWADQLRDPGEGLEY